MREYLLKWRSHGDYLRSAEGPGVYDWTPDKWMALRFSKEAARAFRADVWTTKTVAVVRFRRLK